MLPPTSHWRQVLTVLICMCILVSRVDVEWGEAFKGFLPSKTLVQHGSLYTCTRFTNLTVWFSCDANARLTAVGIIGATVMPHGLFLGSALATQDRASVKPIDLPSMPDQRATRSK